MRRRDRLEALEDEVVDFPGSHFGDLLVAAIVFTAMLVALVAAFHVAGTPVPS